MLHGLYKLQTSICVTWVFIVMKHTNRNRLIFTLAIYYLNVITMQTTNFLDNYQTIKLTLLNIAGKRLLRMPAMHEVNTALLDILVDNSVIVPSFQNRTRLFVGFEKYSLLAELQARTSRSCRFCCFFYLIHSRYP